MQYVSYSDESPKCSRCGELRKMLNEYGVCAECWVSLKPVQVYNLTHGDVRVEVLTQPVTRWRPRGRTIFVTSAAVSAVTGWLTAGGWRHVAAWVGH